MKSLVIMKKTIISQTFAFISINKKKNYSKTNQHIHSNNNYQN